MMARRRDSTRWHSLACLIFIALHLSSTHAFNAKMQGHRVYEDAGPIHPSSAASVLSKAQFEIPASPAVAMNLPANDADDGSLEVIAAQTTPAAAAAANDALATPGFTGSNSSAHAATDTPKPVRSSDKLAQGSSQQAAMFWDPSTSWDAWGLGGSNQLDSMEPSSFSIQISAASSNGSPTKFQITGALNGHGLDLDWQQEDAWRVAEQVEDQMAQAMLPVEDVFNNMLVDATNGLVQSLDALANGGLFDWQQRLFGGVAGGGRRRNLQQSRSSSGQIDLLQLLVPAAV